MIIIQNETKIANDQRLQRVTGLFTILNNLQICFGVEATHDTLRQLHAGPCLQMQHQIKIENTS